MEIKNRQHYWNPLNIKTDYVNEEQFIYTFREEQEAGTWNGWHKHENYGELLNLTEGVMVVCTETQSYVAQANRGVWIPSNLSHEWYMPTKTRNRSLFIHNSVLPLQSKDNILNTIHIIDINPFLRELITTLNDTSLDFRKEADRRLGLVLVDRICQASKDLKVLPMPQNHRLVELCTEFISHPSTQITLSDWSKELNISEKTLARTFVKETGMNFRTWQNTLRMICAKKNIESGMQVTEASLTCGYNSLSAFIVAFKKAHGVSPSKLK